MGSIKIFLYKFGFYIGIAWTAMEAAVGITSFFKGKNEGDGGNKGKKKGSPLLWFATILLAVFFFYCIYLNSAYTLSGGELVPKSVFGDEQEPKETQYQSTAIPTQGTSYAADPTAAPVQQNATAVPQGSVKMFDMTELNGFFSTAMMHWKAKDIWGNEYGYYAEALVYENKRNFAEYVTDGKYSSFTGTLFVDKERNENDTVNMKIYADGVLVLESGPINKRSRPYSFSANIAGAQTVIVELFYVDGHSDVGGSLAIPTLANGTFVAAGG